MPVHYLTRVFRFSASHCLESPALAEAEAEACYGPCRRVHGHNYRLEVTVRGEPDPRTGFFGNVMDLKRLVEELVTDPSEHQHLNALPLYAGAITTMEGLASRIWQVLHGPLAARGMSLHEILVAETDENIVRLRKD